MTGENITSQSLPLTDYQRGIARYWDATADLAADAVNTRLGEVDGLYHHHYGIGEVDPAVLANPTEEAIVPELHRLETAQAHLLLDQLPTTQGFPYRLADFGCGRGGTSFLAHERFAADVDGVSISEYQVEFAARQARERGVDGRVRFYLRNMLDTGFKSGCYDGVWTNETTMYVDLEELFAEVFRLLRWGGRYVCITGCIDDSFGSGVAPAVQRINDRYDCSVHRRGAYFAALAKIGLVPVVVEDLTSRTIPYWELRARWSQATGVEADFLEAYREGSFQYLLIVAERALRPWRSPR